MSKRRVIGALLYTFLPLVLLVLYPVQRALAECRAPEACIACHGIEDFGYPPPEVLESIAEGSCEVGDFTRGHDLSMPRFIHRVAELPDGRVLLTGGAYAIWRITNTVDLFNPDDNSIAPAAAMSVKRWSHTATALQDGRVLVTGGRTGLSTNPASSFFGVLLDTAELYDPFTDSWSPTGSMNVARRSATQTLLPDGQVLICGGGDSVSTGSQMPIQSCETYDASTGMFTIVGDMTTPRTAHSVNLLHDGTALITGGSNGQGTGSPTNLAEIYDPSDDSFTAVGPSNFPHLAQTGANLRDGRVLLAASYYGTNGITNESEIYDPVSQIFTPVNPLFKQRIDIGGQPLLDGTILVAGGVATGGFGAIFHSSSEVYDPATGQWNLSGIMSDGRDEFSGALLRDGRVLVTGGFSRPPGQTTGSRVLDTVEIYSPGLTQQVNGLVNVVGDRPTSAFKGGSSGQMAVLDKVNAIGPKVGTAGSGAVNYEMALRAAGKLQKKIDKKVKDADARMQLHAIVQVLVNSLNQQLSPNLPPTVTAVATPDNGIEPLTVNFMSDTNDPDGSIASTLWTFGDGGISSDAHPIHTYQCDGDYSAKVQVTDNEGAVADDEVVVMVTSAGGPVTYDCDVQPVFNANCISCHGSSAGLNVQSCENLQQGSNHGPVVDPGSKETSVLWQRIDAGTMPPIGGRLPQSAIDGIGAWIDSLNPLDLDFCD
jgi:mono/diheme cytochrome c family protein